VGKSQKRVLLPSLTKSVGRDRDCEH
jgi:hypothetical protein